MNKLGIILKYCASCTNTNLRQFDEEYTEIRQLRLINPQIGSKKFCRTFFNYIKCKCSAIKEEQY